jgi:lysophospholipase L1-like esterase
VPGGDPSRPGPAAAFEQGLLNDRMHPNRAGYRRIIENALRQGMGELLRPKAKPKKPEAR